MEVGHQTGSSGSISSTVSERVRKLFPGMGWFGGNIYGIRQDNNGNIYEILFEDDDNEPFRQDEYDKNTTNEFIRIGNIVLRFVKNVSGG